MNNISKKYRFNDFTLKNYERLLNIALKNFQFSFFTTVNETKYSRTILLRHDIEFSIEISKQLAIIEKLLGVRGTYFIQLHSDFYNALEKKNFDQIKEIESFGHELELHFDTHFWGIKSEDQLEKCLEIDKEVFSSYFNKVPKVFSFHNNNSFTLSCEKDTYAGMINVYSKIFKNDYGYISDSTGYWRFDVLEEKLTDFKGKILQVLIHDGMWQDVTLPPRRRIFKVIEEKANNLKKNYDKTLLEFGAKNIDWNGDINSNTNEES